MQWVKSRPASAKNETYTARRAVMSRRRSPSPVHHCLENSRKKPQTARTDSDLAGSAELCLENGPIVTSRDRKGVGRTDVPHAKISFRCTTPIQEFLERASECPLTYPYGQALGAPELGSARLVYSRRAAVSVPSDAPVPRFCHSAVGQVKRVARLSLRRQIGASAPGLAANSLRPRRNPDRPIRGEETEAVARGIV